MCKWGQTRDCWVKIPGDMSYTGQPRWDWKPIDACIADLVDALNNARIFTVGSCCGHGKADSTIFLEDGRMLTIKTIPPEIGCTVTRNPTWTRFFTWTYWRIQIAAWWTGKPGLNVVEVFEIELSNDQTDCAVEAGELET